MFSTTDTIVAIATPSGRGGIGVVRLSGPDAHAIGVALLARGKPLAPRHATFGTIRLPQAADAPSCVGRVLSDPASTAGPTSLRQGYGGPPKLQRRRKDPPYVPQGDAADHVIVTFFPSPASYTAEDVVEISAHGSPVVLRGIVAGAIARGARLAEPGEFTLRADLNGRLDLMQAEAVADLIDAVTPLQARTAFDQLQGTLTRAIGEIDRMLFDLVARLEASVDFPDEGYHFVDPHEVAAEIDAIATGATRLLDQARRGRLVREGLEVAIVGRPNVGKSSLFNALVGTSRAIVTPVAGTTRDLVTETIDLEGMPVTLIDTAGLRDTADLAELEGVSRSCLAAGVADLVLFVTDCSQPMDDPRRHKTMEHIDTKALVVVNKADLVGAELPETSPRAFSGPNSPVWVSALTGEGLDVLRERMLSALDVESLSDRPAMTNVRHIALVERARDALLRARHAAVGEGVSLPEEFVLADLQEARAALEEVSGKRAPEDLLEHIFSRFCVGK